ncbi:MAG TPA: hypothetical protein VE267_08195 [Bradyrhizobium sp.]|nr:hypothetical protein [Bradyrhizobium sp.]
MIRFHPANRLPVSLENAIDPVSLHRDFLICGSIENAAADGKRLRAIDASADRKAPFGLSKAT